MASKAFNYDMTVTGKASFSGCLAVNGATNDGVTGLRVKGTVGTNIAEFTDSNNNVVAAINSIGDLTGQCAGLAIAIDAGSAVVTTGVKGPRRVSCPMVITDWAIDVDVSATVSVQILKNGTAISASAPVAVTAGTAATSSTLTGWTTTLAKGDTITYNITANNNAKRISITLNGNTV